MAFNRTIPDSIIPYLLGTKTDFSSLQDSVIKVNAVFLSLVVFATGLRFYVRFHMLRATGLDDVLMIVALFFAVVLSTSCLVGERFGLGKHLWNLSPHLIDLPAATSRITKILYCSYLAYSSAITFTKFSIIATYTRILPPGGHLRGLLYAVAFMVAAFWISSIFAVIFTCIPVQAAWDYTITNARCFNIIRYFYVAAGFNIATDLVLCVLPMPTFWALAMPKSERLVLCMLFGMGIFACIASVLRLTQLHNLNGVDISYQEIGSLNWSVIEVGTAIICSSISTLRSLAKRLFPVLFSHFSHPSALSRTTAKSSKEPKFEIVSPLVSTSSGGIYVQKTYDVLELSQLPASPGKARIKTRSGVYDGRPDYYERSSEEDLVGGI